MQEVGISSPLLFLPACRAAYLRTRMWPAENLLMFFFFHLPETEEEVERKTRKEGRSIRTEIFEAFLGLIMVMSARLSHRKNTRPKR